jgi:ArsR family metal-binding transcriptional regulator
MSTHHRVGYVRKKTIYKKYQKNENFDTANRPHEIHVAVIADRSTVSDSSREAVFLVNQTWKERDHITPSLRERKLPRVYDIYQLLPRTNCVKLGIYPAKVTMFSIFSRVVFMRAIG